MGLPLSEMLMVMVSLTAVPVYRTCHQSLPGAGL
jgi:hypothetical protein